jgi:hypothetical protein
MLNRILRAVLAPPRIIYDPRMIDERDVPALALMRPGDVVPVRGSDFLRVLPTPPLTIRIAADRQRRSPSMGPTLRSLHRRFR